MVSMYIITQAVDNKFNYPNICTWHRTNWWCAPIVVPKLLEFGLKGYHLTTHKVNLLRA